PAASSPRTQATAGSTPQTQGGMANDTFIPNDLVTQIAINTIAAATSSNLSASPLPGLLPDGPGCTCPFCRNGGYASARLVTEPVKLAIDHVTQPSESTAPSHPAGWNALVSTASLGQIIGWAESGRPAPSPNYRVESATVTRQTSGLVEASKLAGFNGQARQ